MTMCKYTKLLLILESNSYTVELRRSLNSSENSLCSLWKVKDIECRGRMRSE